MADTNTNPTTTPEQEPAQEQEQEPAAKEQEQKPEGKTFTAEEITRLVHAEADRRVTYALAKQKQEYEKKLSLSALDERERALAEKDMHIQELEEKLREHTALLNKQEVVKTLAGRGLPPTLADVIDIGEDLAEAQKKLDALDAAIKKAVEDGIKARLAGKATPGAGTTASAKMTRDQFRKLTIAQQQELYTNDPRLYIELTK